MAVLLQPFRLLPTATLRGTRRYRFVVGGDLAEQAYGHCLAVLGDPAAAAEAAEAALRRAGRSRSSVLAHARHQSLLQPEPAAPAPETAAPDGVSELATLLAATRPALERAVLDLRARLDRADLGRALGLSSAEAAARADAVAQAWDEQLDPQLMAALGPGDCVELAAVLADVPAATLADLATAGEVTATHLATCETCRDRQRAMVSVRSLLGQPVADVPQAVNDAARRSRRMRPAQPPPPLEPRRRRPLVVAGAAAAAIAVIVAVGATAAALSGDGGGRSRRVADLLKVPASAQLVLTIRGESVDVANRAPHRVHWRASADAAWLEIRPAEGVLDPGASVSLTPRVRANAPEGALRSLITVSGDDGSAAAAVYTTSVERPPDLAAAIDKCAVTATVEDSSGVASVTLHSAEQSSPMTASPSGYTATVPPGAATWWVTATDTRGNQARSPELHASC